jgi:hypothetical protein
MPFLKRQLSRHLEGRPWRKLLWAAAALCFALWLISGGIVLIDVQYFKWCPKYNHRVPSIMASVEQTQQTNEIPWGISRLTVRPESPMHLFVEAFVGARSDGRRLVLRTIHVTLIDDDLHERNLEISPPASEIALTQLPIEGIVGGFNWHIKEDLGELVGITATKISSCRVEIEGDVTSDVMEEEGRAEAFRIDERFCRENDRAVLPFFWYKLGYD